MKYIVVTAFCILSFVWSSLALATGYVPIWTEILMLYHDIKNPEPQPSVILDNYWVDTDSLSKSNIIQAGRNSYAAPIYYCRKGSEFGVADATFKSCTAFFHQSSFAIQQTYPVPFRVLAIEDSDAKMEALVSKKRTVFHWSAPLKKRKDGYSFLVMTGETGHYIVMCRVLSDGALYPGFTVLDDFNNKITGPCHYLQSSDNAQVRTGKIHELLYWETLNENK